MIALIWAQSANGVIGADGQMPWHLPEDMARFRALTAGATVVMGRRTWESLPPKFRPLPGRRNVVLSRQRSYDAPGAEIRSDMGAALAEAGDIWVIGGAAVYAAALPVADRLSITDIDRDFAGDVSAPRLDEQEWREVGRDPAEGWHASSAGLRFRWRELRRVVPAGGSTR